MENNALQTVVDAIVQELSSNKNDITLAKAQKISAAVKEKAKELGVNAVVAVSNSAARPVLVECMDNSYFASYDIAVNKAFTVVALKMSTSMLKPLAQPGNSLYGIQFTNEGKIVIFGGGEPLKNSAGVIVGGLGVSGGTEEQDTLLAEYGKQFFEKGGI
ncbi:MAG: heme-binding protein [Clostridia bacterium]|nr:heme-binding protein [Clostridia bacterium]